MRKLWLVPVVSFAFAPAAVAHGLHSSSSHGSHSSSSHSGSHSSSSHGSHGAYSKGSSSSSHRSTSGAPSSDHRSSDYCATCFRDSHGNIKRSPEAKHSFQHKHACPSTGKTSGACPGYVIDHVKPLACGGADDPSNMQWQGKAAAKTKDAWERNGCRGR